MTSRTEVGNSDEVAEATRRATSKLSHDFSTTARDAGAAAAELASAVQHSAEELGDRTMELGRRAATSARGAAEQVHKTVSEHPLVSVGAAAGIGTLIGLFLASRR